MTSKTPKEREAFELYFSWSEDLTDADFVAVANMLLSLSSLNLYCYNKITDADAGVIVLRQRPACPNIKIK